MCSGKVKKRDMVLEVKPFSFINLRSRYMCAHRTAILVWYILLFKHFQTAFLVLYVLLFKHLIRNLSVIIHPLIQCIICIIVPQNRDREPYRSLYWSPRNPTVQSPTCAAFCSGVLPCVSLHSSSHSVRISAGSYNRANDTGLVDVGQRWLEGNTTCYWEEKTSSIVRSTVGGTSFVFHCYGLVNRKKWCLSSSLL